MIEKIPYRSGRLINGEIIENKNHVKLQKSKTGRWHLSTPRTSDGSVARLIGKNDSFLIDNTGNVVRVNQKGQHWNPSLSLGEFAARWFCQEKRPAVFCEGAGWG